MPVPSNLRVEADRAIGSSLFSLGRLAQASRHLLGGIGSYDPRIDADHSKTYAVNPRVVCAGYQVVCALYLDGEVAGQAEAARLSKLLANEAHPFSKVFGTYWLAWGAQIRGDAEDTLDHARNVIQLSQLHHFPQWEAMGMIFEGWALASGGHAEVGIGRCREGLLRHRATGSRIFQPYFLLLLAQAYQMAGSDRAKKPVAGDALGYGLIAVEYALQRASLTGEETWTTECLRVQAELTLASGGRARDAERLLRKAVATASAQGAAALEVRALASLCRCLFTTGRVVEARALQKQVTQELRRRALPTDLTVLDAPGPGAGPG